LTSCKKPEFQPSDEEAGDQVLLFIVRSSTARLAYLSGRGGAGPEEPEEEDSAMNFRGPLKIYVSTGSIDSKDTRLTRVIGTLALSSLTACQKSSQLSLMERNMHLL
jgi:hypothetical protein